MTSKRSSSRARAREDLPESADSRRSSGDEALLAAMLRGLTIPQAAREAEMAERTARDHVRKPEFRARLDTGRAEVMTAVAAQLAGGAEIGYAVLLAVAMDRTTPPAVRRSAARDLIRLAGEIGNARDLEGRLEALEDAVRQAGLRL